MKYRMTMLAALAAVLALPERSAEWTAWVGGQRPHLLCVVALSWFALVSLFLVVDMGQEIRQRRQVITGLLDAAEQQNVGKGEITDAVFLENFIGNAKYLPCISLVHTATERRAWISRWSPKVVCNRTLASTGTPMFAPWNSTSHCACEQ